MKETVKLAALFTDLQRGDCWIGVNMETVLAGVDHLKAARKPFEEGNSVWQLVNHITYWRKTVMLRLSGRDAYPEGADMYQPGDPGEVAWAETLADFRETYQAFINSVLIFDERSLYEASPKPEQTFYQLLMGSLEHEAYHMGQMVLVKKFGLKN